MDRPQPNAAGGFHIGRYVVHIRRAARRQSILLQRVLIYRRIRFQQADLVREHVRVEVVHERVVLEDEIHVDRVRIRHHQPR